MKGEKCAMLDRSGRRRNRGTAPENASRTGMAREKGGSQKREASWDPCKVTVNTGGERKKK